MKNPFRLAVLLLCLAVVAVTPSTSAQPAAAVATAANAETQTVKIYRTLRDQDWKAWYYLAAFSPKLKAELKEKGTTADDFAADVWKGYNSSFKTPEEKKATDDIFKSITEIMVGEAVITGQTAVVPTTAKISAGGKTRTFKGAAHLVDDAGVWKLDLTFSDDAEKATSQRVSEIFGSPVDGQ